MDALPVNAFDLIILTVLLLSGLIALARGMVKELLKLASWIGAGVAAFYGFAFARPYVRDFVPIEPVADGLAAVGIFLVTLVALSFLANVIASHVRDSGLSALDRTLGLVFGLVRGGLVVSLAYLFMTWIVNPRDIPDWVLQGRTQPIVETGAGLLVSLAPRSLRDETATAAETTKQRLRQAIEAERAARQLRQPPRTEAGKDDPSGYSDKQRKEMDRLIQGNQ